MIPSNYHTHTTFCHGADTPEELVQEAIRLGCPAIGLTSHSFTDFDDSYCMTKEGTEAYIAEVRALQEKYKDQIKIYLGVEQDFYSENSTAPYDYAIGSVHYVKKDGVYLSIDEAKENQQNFVAKHYGGDWYAFAEDYFATVAQVYEKTGCQIIAHFDLITKFNSRGDLFDTKHPRYLAAAEKALSALLKTPAALEVNYGAIARGYTEQPYPEPWVISRWLKAGKPVCYSSDCHNRHQLLLGYTDYETLINKLR
jgi:histidinol-phosphatase (PHP family)